MIKRTVAGALVGLLLGVAVIFIPWRSGPDDGEIDLILNITFVGLPCVILGGLVGAAVSSLTQSRRPSSAGADRSAPMIRVVIGLVIVIVLAFVMSGTTSLFRL